LNYILFLDSEEEEDQPQQVTVKVGRTESEKLKKAREKSFGFLQKKNAEEVWIQTEFCPFGSEKSMMERNQLLTNYPNENVSVLALSKEKYLASLISQTEETDPKSSEVMSMYHIKSLPLGEQVRLLMLNGSCIYFVILCVDITCFFISLFLLVRLISFARLCETLGVTGDSQQDQLLRSVQQVASLIQGNWVVKSEVLYPKDKMCGVTGVNHEIITKARDYVVSISIT
jgi:DNA-directed RNA polymerase III subunit RPC5